MAYNDRKSVYGYGADSPVAKILSVLGYTPGSITAQLADGSVVTRTGDRASRNFNPGNIRPASWEFKAPYNAVGVEGNPLGKYGQMSVYPSAYEGNRAREHLMFENKRYANLSLADAISQYAPDADYNNSAAYAKQLATAAGVDPSRKMSSFTPAERHDIMQAQLAVEGNTGAAVKQISPPGQAASNFPNPSETIGQAGVPGYGKPGELGAPPAAPPQPQAPGFFSFGGFAPQMPSSLTLQDPAPKAYDPLSSMHPPSMDMASQLMSGLTPPASIPTPAPVQADMSGGFGLGVGAAGRQQAQVPPHIADPTAKPDWSAPTADPMSSMYGLGTLAPAMHAPWSVEGQMQPPAVSRAPAAPQAPSMQGMATLGAGFGSLAPFSKKISDPFSNPQPVQAYGGAYSPPSLPGWTVHDTPPGQFATPGRQPAMGAFTQASTGAPQAPQAGGWVARGIPSFNQPAPMAPRSTAQATMQARPGLGIGATATGSLSFAKPQVTRSIQAPPTAPHVYTKPESALSPAAMPSWASLAAAAATSAVPGLGMLAAMPAASALAQKAMAAFPGLPQPAPAVPPAAAVAPPVAAPVAPPRPKPLAMPAPIAPRPHPAADPSLSGWGTMAAANNPFQAAGLSLMGQSALGKPMYGGGYINGVQQMFSGNKPSNAFGGLGYGNPFSGLAGLFSSGVQRAQQVPGNVGSFLGGLFGGGTGPTNSGGGFGGFGGGGSGGGGTFGGGGWGGGPGSPGHRDSSH